MGLRREHQPRPQLRGSWWPGGARSILPGLTPPARPGASLSRAAGLLPPTRRTVLSSTRLWGSPQGKFPCVASCWAAARTGAVSDAPRGGTPAGLRLARGSAFSGLRPRGGPASVAVFLSWYMVSLIQGPGRFLGQLLFDWTNLEHLFVTTFPKEKTRRWIGNSFRKTKWCPGVLTGIIQRSRPWTGFQKRCPPVEMPTC